ncbi:MAG: spore cortex-lytic enzyme [Clostridiales bacterium]|nr:spore cortex-lytic enzyme [Clostridiales bacterium]
MRKYKVYFCIICIMFMISVFTIGYCGFGRKSVLAYDSSHIYSAQERLKELGYYDGEVNGVYDDATVVAIKNFQADNGIYVSGAVGGVTANALGIYMSEQDSNDLYLLAKCIHAEARGESYTGKVAVGAVILNRVASPDFPDTIYGVIYQPWAFTAVHDGQINLEPEAASYQAATDALNGWDPTYGCLYYYNPVTASSSWIFSRQTVVTIGKHVFAI